MDTQKVKLIAIADIHWDQGRYEWLQCIKDLQKKSFDILLIAGDIAVYDESYRIALSEINKIECKYKMIVLGNHDIWLTDDCFNSFQKYELKHQIAENLSYIFLDGNPTIFNNIGFIGNIGWYDYSLRDKSLDSKYPLADFMYKTKRFPNGKGRWMDGVYAKWRIPDNEVTQYFAKRLEEDILKIYNKCNSICFLMHHIPCEHMVTRKDENWNMGNAFVGSSVFENIIRKYNKINFVVCGHTHTSFDENINGVRYINVGADYRIPKYVEIDICL
jgi:putative phosphoesterase